MTHWDIPNTTIRDQVHSILKNFEAAFSDELKKTEIKRCKICDGSGLNVCRGNDKTINIWVPGEYCKSCRGFGYTGFDRVYDSYICKSCNGKGCDKCSNTGMIDWVKNVMG